MPNLVPGNLSQLNAVMDLVDAVIKGLKNQGIDQWDEIYPDRSCMEKDLKSGELCLAIHNCAIVGSITLNTYQESAYASANWTLDRPAVIHRLMVHPNFQGRGLAKTLMHWAESKARSEGLKSIRLDAFTANPNAMAFYQNLGYHRCGECRFRKGIFALFEKSLDQEEILRLR